MLAQRSEDVARMLLPDGKKSGSEWCVGDITGIHGKSLKIHLTGTKAGIWADFANGSKSGDLIDLWSATRNVSLIVALKEAMSWLGVTQPHFEAHRALKFSKPMQKNTPELKPCSQAMNYLINDRKLTTKTILDYKISEQSGKIVFPYWRDGELIFIKYLGLDRVGGKKQIAAEPNCEPCLFGWHLIPPNARTITICEGEIDAMTLHQYGIFALSVPFGGGIGGKQKWLEYEFDRLAIFDEINLCFDSDTEGKAAVMELVERLGRHRCRIINLPFKDANACLQSAMSIEMMSLLFSSSQTLDPEELKLAKTFVDQVINEFFPPNGCEVGIMPPWEKSRGKILFRPDELSIFTGINGHGKSQFLGQIILASMLQGAKVCIASLELKARRLLMRLTRQASGVAEPSIEYIQAIHEWYGDKLWLFDLLGTAKSSRLLEVFTYARRKYGISVFVIDSFLKLDIDEEDYKSQKSFIEKLCDFKNEYNCHVHIIAHPRKGADESHQPSKLDIKGTGAITDLADNCFSIWRNKRKEKEVEKSKNNTGYSGDMEILKQPDCYWICDKQRNGDWEGKLGFWFDPSSLQYLNHQNQKPVQFVSYSNTGLNAK
ncbi:MAG: toprim domain-containing protein [Gammaproteobacteria bacterium]